jgi:hypothetical protein
VFTRAPDMNLPGSGVAERWVHRSSLHADARARRASDIKNYSGVKANRAWNPSAER